MKVALSKLWAFLLKNWNIIVAFIASAGFLISSLLPSRGAYTESFAFLGLAAILLTLVEIKVLVSRSATTTRFNDMRAARPDILDAIKKEVSKYHMDTCEIQIVGGRIRTISDMLRDILHKIEIGELNAKNIKFSIYCMCPDFITSWSSNKILDAEFSARMSRQANLVKTYSDDLLAFNSRSEFQKNNVTVEINHYKSFPTIYAFLVGGTCLFWGNFTWNPEKNDFEGPENPCYSLDKRSENFEDNYKLIQNRINFLRIGSSIQYT